MEKTETSLITKLIDLYLSVKIRSEEDLDKVDEEGLERERKELARANPLVLVDYIRASIEILLKLREERRSSSMYNSVQSGKEVQEDYEEQIQKLEAETRMHIRVEQQLKLHVDSIQAKLEEYEKTISKLTKSIKRLETKLLDASNRMLEKTNEAERLKKLLDERARRITTLERTDKLNATTIKYSFSKLSMDDASSIIKEVKTDFSPGKKRKEGNRKATASISRVPQPPNLPNSGKKSDSLATQRPNKTYSAENHSHLRSSSHRGEIAKEDNKEPAKSIALQYKQSLKIKDESKKEKPKEVTQMLQRNTTIDNLIKNFEKQANKSRLLANNRPCSTYRERASYKKPSNKLLGTAKVNIKVVQNS
eukprot:TRINITY_DN8215_c0_g1_i6.p1 TRINITY_DN8215_c0_g1~~TRINITY_DN8215_c0_g1_i6.p1  ORF type:complete len:365 (+),score=127.94 TRINITY_DN8215_c0_g1_i6:164-1258(+)